MQWGKIFEIDFRSLRLFRFGLGMYFIIDIALRIPHFPAFMTEQGALPMHLVRRPLSLFMLSPSPVWAGFLFALMLGMGLCLITNYRPRTASVIGFVLALSLRNRNQLLMYGADDLFRLGLMWSAFLPSGPSREGQKTFCSLASFAALGQLFILYLSAGMSKEYRVWVEQPIATFVSLGSDTYAKPITRIIMDYPLLLKWSSIAVFFIERAGWVLFFSPWKNAGLRVAGFTIFALMHLSFGMFLHLELFPMINITFLVLLLPRDLWDRLEVNHSSRVIELPRFERWTRWTAPAVLAMLFYIVVCSMPGSKMVPVEPVRLFAKTLGIYQAWTMFTPIPGLSDGYYRVISRSPAGVMVDEINQKVLEHFPTKPVDPQEEMGGFRWTRYFEEVSISEGDKIKKQLMRYFCRRWTPEVPGAESREITLYHFHETTLAPELPIVTDLRTLISLNCKGD